MRDLFDQGRAMSPALIKTGTGVLGALLGAAGALVFLQGLGNILSFNAPLTGIIQIAGGLGFLLAVYLIVRLLGESVMALHRLNDRLTVLSSELTANRTSADLTPQPAAKPAPVKSTASKPARRSKAKTSSKPAEQKQPAEESTGESTAKSTSTAEA
ncbi:MAG: hypothetical protein AAF498_15750 [Pseudomonadota bacterium]